MYCETAGETKGRSGGSLDPASTTRTLLKDLTWLDACTDP